MICISGVLWRGVSSAGVMSPEVDFTFWIESFSKIDFSKPCLERLRKKKKEKLLEAKRYRARQHDLRAVAGATDEILMAW